MMKRFMSRFVAMVMLSALMCLSWAQNASANLVITPFIVVFEGNERFKEVVVVNSGNETMTYEMEWSFLNMTEGTGKYVAAENAGDGFDMTQHVVFSPRRVTLTPGAKQKVRLRISRPENMPNGDYHTHLRFSAVARDLNAPVKFDPKNPKIDVSVSVSYAIPVIVRAGDLPMEAQVGDLNITRNENSGQLEVAIPLTHEKDGAAILSHMYVYHIDGAGKETLVGEVSNANVFPEINTKVYHVPLRKEITGGRLKVVLQGLNDNGVVAERIFPLQ